MHAGLTEASHRTIIARIFLLLEVEQAVKVATDRNILGNSPHRHLAIVGRFINLVNHEAVRWYAQV
jgi:hypothetical protein